MEMNTNISLIRIIATCGIVFSHAFAFYGSWLNIFPDADPISFNKERSFFCELCLNAFVFISGYLYADHYLKGHYREHLLFLWDKIKRLLIPYLIWSVILFAIFSQFINWSSVFEGCQHLWFLLMLFGCFVLIRIFNIESTIKVWGGVIFLVILTYPILTYTLVRVPNFFAWKHVLHYFPGFLLGCFLARFEGELSSRKNEKKCLLIMIIICAVATIWINLYSGLPKKQYYEAVPSYFLIMSSLLYMNKYFVIKFPKIALNFDKVSIGIYLVHQPLIMTLLFYVPALQIIMKAHTFIAPMSLFIIVLIISWGVSACIAKSNILKRLLMGQK